MSNWLNVLAFLILLCGSCGYVTAIALLLLFRRWMGGRGEGWPRILLNTLLGLVGFLALLYFDSLLRQAGVNSDRNVRLALSFFEGVMLMLIPWVLTIAVWRWWPRRSRDRTLRDILPRRRT